MLSDKNAHSWLTEIQPLTDSLVVSQKLNIVFHVMEKLYSFRYLPNLFEEISTQKPAGKYLTQLYSLPKRGSHQDVLQ